MILLTLIARLKDSLILVSSSKAADEADPNVEKYTRQAEMMLRTLNAPGTSAVRSFKSEPYLFHYVIKGSICALSVCEEKFARNTTFAFLTDIAKAFLKQNGARVDVVATPYYFFEFDKYIEGAKRKHAVQAVNTKPQDLSRTTVSNTKKVVQRVHLLITARQVASVLAQKKTVVIIDYRTSKPNYIQCKCEHLRLLFIDASYISTRSDLSALLNQTTEPDKTVLRSLGDYYMVVLMGDDEEQHHESIMDYHKKSKPRMLFDILHKDNMDGTRPKRVLMLSDGFPGWIGAFPNYVSNSKYIHWKDAPIPPAPDVFSLLDVRPKPKTEQAWLVELKAAANAARNGTTASRAITPARPPKPTKEPAPKAPKTTASADAPAPPSSSPPPGA
ncbi:vesicle trafficking protein SEC22b [Aphelenchoides avenae]|nr:vesicle trafficking protein SEC22b [Aphelenchus avenae]